MREEVEAARKEADSVGGVVETFAVGLPAGLGGPEFDGVESGGGGGAFRRERHQGCGVWRGLCLCRHAR